MPEAELVLDSKCALGEGPVWHDGALWFVNILGGELHRFDGFTGEGQAQVGEHELRREGLHAAAHGRGGEGERQALVERREQTRLLGTHIVHEGTARGDIDREQDHRHGGEQPAASRKAPRRMVREPADRRIAHRIEQPDQIGAAWDRALATDRPVVIDAVVDPEVPPLPPHITWEQAKGFLSAVLKDPDRSTMIKRSFQAMKAKMLPGASARP